MFIKRIFDVAISILGLIILLPMLIIIALIIKIKLGKPIFFIQERVGKRNKIFKMIKFRTMKDIKDENGKVLPDEKRHTTIGKTLRALSLDEIPELINVIKGDMSLVGPRPLLVEYVELYSEEQFRRHEVRPGITGWAQ
ncbi:MAG: sugar transferase, partial [Clostridium sulfidigenes]|nr:sugar transferase [Clostridium sulfidigenes]